MFVVLTEGGVPPNKIARSGLSARRMLSEYFLTKGEVGHALLGDSVESCCS